MKPRWDSQVNPQFPVPAMDGVIAGFETGKKAGEELAEGDLPGAVETATGDEPSTMPASEKPESAKEREEKNAAILRAARTRARVGVEADKSKPHANAAAKAFQHQRHRAWGLLLG